MTQKERQMVRASFVELQEAVEPLALLFYGRLFAVEPGLRGMFTGDIGQQGKKLMDMVGAAVEGMENWKALEPALKELGRRHVGYGVKREHYGVVAEAMVWAIGQALEHGADREVKQAWGALLGEVAGAMLAGCED